MRFTGPWRRGHRLFVVDTNVLVHAADRHSSRHAHCRELVEGWRKRSGAWYLTWGIVYEFLRVTTHLRVLRQPWSAIEAWGFIEALLSSPGADCLTPTPRHPAVISEVLNDIPDLRGNLIHDTTTAILMREHGIRTIYTFDTDFHRFPFVTVVDPGRT